MTSDGLSEGLLLMLVMGYYEKNSGICSWEVNMRYGKGMGHGRWARGAARARWAPYNMKRGRDFCGGRASSLCPLSGSPLLS